MYIMDLIFLFSCLQFIYMKIRSGQQFIHVYSEFVMLMRNYMSEGGRSCKSNQSDEHSYSDALISPGTLLARVTLVWIILWISKPASQAQDPTATWGHAQPRGQSTLHAHVSPAPSLRVAAIPARRSHLTGSSTARPHRVACSLRAAGRRPTHHHQEARASGRRRGGCDRQEVCACAISKTGRRICSDKAPNYWAREAKISH
jgi:hypothetical protein